ncbi:hypothetical protein N7468_009917 [Penicillium chermesinum]|uniref:Uncharacterized protein n=1 Tax=Penicillium chermesinum TaxID=63820 RepID=A0A9W9NDF4_9EURO|nr:uncharacterized protein N7468_009917 [Penicillium chermesinum]KAJ5216909.1 hypothetical protein N7468_009917 [Penicillium chermesinum]
MSDSASEGWHPNEPDHLGSDAGTEEMTTPEFWGALHGEDLAFPGKHEAAIASSSIPVPTKPLERIQSDNQLQSDHRKLKVTEDSFDDHFGAAGMESEANDHKCLGKAASTWDPSVSTAIDYEIAKIYNHADHCRNAYCSQAKAFFDEIQSRE